MHLLFETSLTQLSVVKDTNIAMLLRDVSVRPSPCAGHRVPVRVYVHFEGLLSCQRLTPRTAAKTKHFIGSLAVTIDHLPRELPIAYANPWYSATFLLFYCNSTLSGLFNAR